MTPNNLENRASTFPATCRKRNPNGCASTASIEFDRLQFGGASVLKQSTIAPRD
jgi:hypothetical protein